jgi:hypothetical protein
MRGVLNYDKTKNNTQTMREAKQGFDNLGAYNYTPASPTYAILDKSGYAQKNSLTRAFLE